MATGEDAALGIVRHSWSAAYEIAEADIGELTARRRDGKGGVIRAATADELGLRIAADYSRDPVALAEAP